MLPEFQPVCSLNWNNMIPSKWNRAVFLSFLWWWNFTVSRFYSQRKRQRQFEWNVLKSMRIFLYLHFNVNFSPFISAFTQNLGFALKPLETGNWGVNFHYFSPVLQNQCLKYTEIFTNNHDFFLCNVNEKDDLVTMNIFISFNFCRNLLCGFPLFSMSQERLKFFLMLWYTPYILFQKSGTEFLDEKKIKFTIFQMQQWPVLNLYQVTH